MTKVENIFSKLRFQPGQLRSVAERRFADAQCLLDSGNVERANGAIYMAGFVIECLLKALLLERHRNLAKPVDPAKLSASDGEVLTLLYSHNLDYMLEFLPEIELKLRGIRTSGSYSRGALCEISAKNGRFMIDIPQSWLNWNMEDDTLKQSKRLRNG